MTQQRDSQNELRAAHLLRGINNAKRSVPMGPTGVFMRVTLAVVFMYLIVASHLMLGIIGPVFVSILFLVAFFVPVLYHSVKAIMDQRRETAARAGRDEEGEVHHKA